LPKSKSGDRVITPYPLNIDYFTYVLALAPELEPELQLASLEPEPEPELQQPVSFPLVLVSQPVCSQR
jgi:hypothetical protein